MNYIRFLKDIHKKDIFFAGGKGSSLGEMYNLKYPIPNAFVITSSAFEKHLKDNNINTQINKYFKEIKLKDTSSIEKMSYEIKKLILNSSISKEIEKEILDALKSLNAEYIAVRSSATAEDSKSNAWAGQLDTFLYIRSNKNIIENVKKCWASLFNKRAIIYRIAKNQINKKILVAVVIQKMINSEKSGIAFSINPISNNREEIIIEAGYGLGEAIVSGQITPDNYIVSKDLNIKKRTKGKQEKVLFRKENSSGTIWKDLPTKNKVSFVLSKNQILEISKIILNLEKDFGYPVDVEWAIEGNKIYITQSRPITNI